MLYCALGCAPGVRVWCMCGLGLALMDCMVLCVWPPGFACSRGGAAMHLSNQNVVVMMASSKIKCAGPMGRREVVRGHARQRVKQSLTK
eukprot:scaffold8542_cov119-Isochrysis_galbana.AAC.5